MRQVLLPLALSDTGLLAAVLLSACRSLEGRHGKMEARTRTATANSCRWSSEVARWRIAGWRYKGEAIAQVRDRVGDEGENVSEETVAIVLMLAADEVGDSVAFHLEESC